MVKIVYKNNSYEVYVTDVLSDGKGVAKIDGYPLFIDNAVTGDKLLVTVTKTNKNYGFARNDKIISPSPFRKTPECLCFEKCGGCDSMHIDYAYQLKLKENFVKNNMSRIGGILEDEYEFEGIISADDAFGYRNKAQFPVGKFGKKTVCGFYEKRSHEIIPCDNCLIQSDDINRAVSLVLEYANENNVSVYDEKTHKGILRHVYIRSSNSLDELMAVIVTNSDKRLPNEDKLIQKLANLKNIKSIIQNINTKKTNLILGDKNRIIWGSDHIKTNIKNLKFKISAHSFFQVNGKQTEKLYQKALQYAAPENDTVFDLYCGAGTISLFLAQKAKKVIGVEIVEAAVENAKENAALNGIKNAEFYAGDCTEVVENLIKNGETADIVVVDPPRKGCSEELLKFISDISPKRLVYVSCNSATLARDAAIMKGYGYKLKKLSAVDMFPNSGHIECCALLCRK